MVFKPICECLNIPFPGPAMKCSKRGGHGKQLSLGFYPLFCFLACYSLNTRDFLCTENEVPYTTAFHFTPFQVVFLFVCFEHGGVMEAESGEEIKLTEQEKYSLLQTLRQLEMYDYMTPRKERLDFMDIQIRYLDTCMCQKSCYISRCQNAISVFGRSLSDVFCLSIITVFCFPFHFKKHTIPFLFGWWLLFS